MFKIFRWRNLLIFIGLILIIGGFWVHQSYSLDYVARVLIKQESDHDDFLWKPKVEFGPAASTSELPTLLAPAIVREAFEHSEKIDVLDDFMERTGTTAFLVMKQGRLIYEAYYQNRDAASLHATFSISKSFTSILIGQAIERGDIDNIEDPITKYLPELLEKDSRFAKITLAHLIDMRSGIAFDSDVSFPFVTEDQPLVYYGNDLKQNIFRYTRIIDEPGKFLYNDYNPNILGMALEKVSATPVQVLFQENVWDAIGAEHEALWSTDYADFPLFESGLAATGRDLARFGQMMLNGGVFEGRQVISESWHQRSTNRQKEHDFDKYDGRQWGYRNGWWLIARPQPPHDYAAIGHLGQYIYISAINQTVIVRTGSDRIGISDPDMSAIFYQASNRLSTSSE